MYDGGDFFEEGIGCCFWASKLWFVDDFVSPNLKKAEEADKSQCPKDNGDKHIGGDKLKYL